MKREQSPTTILIALMVAMSIQAAITDLTPAEVRARLVAGDNVLLLDVREQNEYMAGHIAEPADYLPLTPASMPYTTGVLVAQHGRLPTDIDIIVYCASGNRSDKSSDSLIKWGFTRVFNMTSGFARWSQAGYEWRDGGLGDHSGSWVRSYQSTIIAVGSSGVEDSSTLSLTAQILPTGHDSAYFELHAAWGKKPIPSGFPASDIQGLYRVTALDAYGVSLFVNDSLTSVGNVDLRCSPAFPNGTNASTAIASPGFAVIGGADRWVSHPAIVTYPVYALTEKSLHRWYATIGLTMGSVVIRGHQPLSAGRASTPTLPGVQASVDGRISTERGRGIHVNADDRSRQVVLSPSPLRR